MRQRGKAPNRRVLGLLSLGLLSLVACTSTGPAAPTAGHPPVPPEASPGLATVSFCVGVSAAHPADSTAVVPINFLRSGKVFAASGAGLSTRLTVQMPPGPFSVEVDGVTQLSGTATVAGEVGGSMGRDCPPITAPPPH